MEELQNQAKILLADVFALYLKTHFYHWNVEGDDFYPNHLFFGELYEEIYGSVDSLAEHIRALNAYAPGSLARYKSLTNISEDDVIKSPSEMVTQLFADNAIVMSSIKRVFELAETENEIGFSNFLQDRYDVHKKHQWMLRSILKRANNG